MSLNIATSHDFSADPLELVEACLEVAGWEHQREEDRTLQCVADDAVILFRHTLPMLDRSEPEAGEVRAVIAAATDAINMFVPAFNFVIWAGKTPREAMDAAMFETDGEA